MFERDNQIIVPVLAMIWKENMADRIGASLGIVLPEPRKKG